MDFCLVPVLVALTVGSGRLQGWKAFGVWSIGMF